MALTQISHPAGGERRSDIHSLFLIYLKLDKPFSTTLSFNPLKKWTVFAHQRAQNTRYFLNPKIFRILPQMGNAGLLQNGSVPLAIRAASHSSHNLCRLQVVFGQGQSILMVGDIDDQPETVSVLMVFTKMLQIAREESQGSCRMVLLTPYGNTGCLSHYRPVWYASWDHRVDSHHLWVIHGCHKGGFAGFFKTCVHV